MSCDRIASKIRMVQHLETLATFLADLLRVMMYLLQTISSTVTGLFHTNIGRFATQDLPHRYPPTNICYTRCFVA